jgi:trehalose monomycolate/heme transporter
LPAATVFLLSRIRERYDITGDTTEAVASGLQRTGGLITSLALLLIIVVGAFSASGITFIKLMGVGMIVALIVDASIVRVLLVPPARGGGDLGRRLRRDRIPGPA